VPTSYRSRALKIQSLARSVVPLKTAEQAQVYFHRSRTEKVFVDSRGAVVNDLAEAGPGRRLSWEQLPAPP